MSEQYAIREMTVSDIPHFGNMMVQMVQEAPRNFSVSVEFIKDYVASERFLEGMERSVKANEAGRFVVDSTEGRYAAAVETVIKNDSLRIGNMYVQKDFRSQGLGSKLLQACEDRGLQDGFGKTSLVVGSGNFSAVALYQRNGYRRSNPRVLDFWDLHPGVYGELLTKNLA